MYVKQTFKDGEVLKAAHLNHIEDGLHALSEKFEDSATHLPTIGENGNWWEWDGTAYVDTGKPSRGEAGADGAPGPAGPAYELTEADKQELVDAVLAALPDGDEVSY